MYIRRFGLCLALAATFLTAGPTVSSASEIRAKFMGALEKNDRAGMMAVVENNKEAIPAEVKALIEETKAPDATDELKHSNFFIAELLARDYKDLTGDVNLLIEVKKRAFDSKLSGPVRANMTDGVHIVDIPLSTGHSKNKFAPDNIVIKQGETVRWVNSDEIDHIFSTMPIISAGRFSAKSIPPGGSWEFKFDKPGEYFYLCFIHQSMIGKITVEGDAPAVAPAAAPAVETPETRPVDPAARTK